MTSSEGIEVDAISLTSLYLEAYGRGKSLASATGFTIEHEGHPFLITNWHVVAGYHPETGQCLSKTGALPDELRMFCHSKSERLARFSNG